MINYNHIFGQESNQLHYIDTQAFVLSVNTEDIIKDLKILEDIFDFSIPDENHEIFSDKNKKVIGKFSLETPKTLIDEFVCLRSKMCSFNWGDDGKKNKKCF